jgi:hypothetical protein
MAIDNDNDLDALVRTAMKTLDEQVPSGYFEALPNRTLERLALEEGTMQAGSTSGSEAKSSSATPSSGPQAIPKVPVEEDSGLHDIRSLAQTTKERISSKRITLSPTRSVSEEELIASASGSWKSLALPQPASMVSLPALADLPPASVVEPSKPSKPLFAAAVAKQQAAPATSSRKLMAIAGLGIAAAAGVTLFVTMSSKSDVAAPKPEPKLDVATAAAPAPMPIAPPAAPVVQHIDEPAAGSAAVVAAATPPTETTPAPTPNVPSKLVATKSRAIAPAPVAHAAKPATIAAKDQAPAPTAPEGKKAEGGSGGKGDATGKAVANGQESLDQLIKEAGAEDKPKAGPALDKKELSAGDFKAGMSAIQGKAQACFKGTQGTAAVKLVIVPSGKVTRVTVTGKFAGKPEAECVTAAVKAATFPPWDGGSQTMGYSFLLSE